MTEGPEMNEPDGGAPDDVSQQTRVPDEPAAEAQSIQSQLDNVNSQLAMVRFQAQQQLGALSSQLQALTEQVGQEFRRFRTGGPKQAIAAVYARLFRDLIDHMNTLDELADDSDVAGGGAWHEAVKISRDRFENILVEWGCDPIVIECGVTEFDPDLHEALPAGEAELPSQVRPNTIYRVARRGWRMAGKVIQFPLVVAS